MKVCKTCGLSKPLDQFYNSPKGADKKRAHCIPCYTIKYYRPSTPESRAKTAADKMRRDKANPAKAWRSYLRIYGVSPEWYEHELEVQQGCCAICGVPANTFGYRLSVDHDHMCCPGQRSCGECVRGLLCRSCNFGIGNLGDSIETLRSAITYLERSQVAYTCTTSGFLVRVVERHLYEIGVPLCPCHMEPMTPEVKGDE